MTKWLALVEANFNINSKILEKFIFYLENLLANIRNLNNNYKVRLKIHLKFKCPIQL